MKVKKVLTYLLLTIVTLLLTLFITYWIAPDWVEDIAVDILYPTVTIEDEYINTVSLEIPKVYELMYIACSLTETFKQDENFISKRTPKYYADVQNHFGSYDQHPLVTLLEDKLKNNAYSQVQPAIRLFALNYDLEQDNSLKENEIFHVNPLLIKLFKSKIFYYPDYKAQIEDFAKKTNFHQFYTDHNQHYNLLKIKYLKLCNIDRMWTWMEDRFPEKYDSYRIIFSPLTGGFHNTLPGLQDPISNLKQTWMFVSPPSKTNLDTLSQEELEVLSSKVEREVFTEIDHNYVNPISDKYRTKIEEAIPDYRQWNHQKNGYRSSMSTFNEYMTWAIFSLYALENYQPEQIEKILSVQEAFMVERRKFIHFKTFNRELIRLYEDQRAKTGKIELETLYSPILKWMEKKR